MRKYAKMLAVCLISLSFAGSLWAKVAGEHMGLVAPAMGGAYRAVANGNEAIYFNPAGMVYAKRYELDADYAFHSPSSPPHFVGLSLVDSMTSDLAAGLDAHFAFTPETADQPLSYLIMANLALAYPFAQIFSVGATLRYVFNPEAKVGQVVHTVTGDVGLTLKFPIGISLAVVGTNLVPTSVPELPLSVGIGAAYRYNSANQVITDSPSKNYNGLTLAVDFLLRDLVQPKKINMQLAAGAEYYIVDMIPLRLGYTWEISKKAHYLSTGLGLFMQIFEFDIFYQQNIFDLDQRTIGAGVRFFFL